MIEKYNVTSTDFLIMSRPITIVHIIIGGLSGDAWLSMVHCPGDVADFSSFLSTLSLNPLLSLPQKPHTDKQAAKI